MKAEILNTRDQRIRTDIKKLVRRLSRDFPMNRTVINIVFVNNRKVQELNLKFLKRNRPTDVLAFPLGFTDPDNSAKVLGEVYVSRDQARLQAKQNGLSYYDEIQHLVLHGCFHLFGFNHQQMPALYAKYL